MQRCIAVIDDDTDTLEMITAMLEMEGYTVYPYLDHWQGRELAFRSIRKRRPDLLVLDLMMGGHSYGWTLLWAIRADAATAEIPVILYSANTRFLQQWKADLEQKGCAVLAKPFRTKELFDKITAAFGTGTSQSDQGEGPNTLQHPD
jgi:DNA-binding response OmpR family regulator